MLTPRPANPYHAVVRQGSLLRGTDGRTALKLYYIDILGRPESARTVWADSGMTEEGFAARLAATPGVEGVGFVTAFPHVTKLFRFGPETEIVLNVRGWNTRDLSDLPLGRSDGYVEYACLAEAVLAAEEFAFWQAAPSVEAYLAQWSAYAEGAIADKDKLRRYWGA